MREKARRALVLAAVFALGLVASLASTNASAAVRAVLFVYRYPASGNCAGVALYHGASRADIDAGARLTRVDLGLRSADAQGNVNVSIAGFDDTRDYYVALRCYDASGSESANSSIGVIHAAASTPPSTPGVLYQEDFESYAPGQDPAGWIDSAPGTMSPGDAALFETVRLPDGTMAFSSATSAVDVHSHLDAAGAAGWSSYEYSGRIESDAITGMAGVTVLSAYPESQFYYRLARVANGPFVLLKRGNGDLTCVADSSTGVTADAGVWLSFRVRVTRFDGRNRIRASIWRQGSAAPASWQADCWDSAPESIGSGRIGVYSFDAAGTQWDDLRVETVAADGAPPGYGTTPPPPPPSGGGSGGGSGGSSGSGGGSVGAYTSASQLEHWWRLGLNPNDLGQDFASNGGIDASRNSSALNAADAVAAGSSNAEVDFDGRLEALGNFKLSSYGVGNSWSVAAWVRPAKLPIGARRSYIFELNGRRAYRSFNGISLVLDSTGHFLIEVSDSKASVRGITSSSTIDMSRLGSAWYHVVAVKTGTSSLALYVNGVQVASTNIGIPAQTDSPRMLRIGARMFMTAGQVWNGGIASVGLWQSALGSSEISALYAGGNRGVNLKTTLP